MSGKKIRLGLEQVAGLAIPLALVLLLPVPAPAWAALAAPPAASKVNAAAQARSAASTKSADRFCANSDCTKTRQTFRRLCDFIVNEKKTYPTIYIGGYYMRDLVAGYATFGDRRYLDTAIAYGDWLLKQQRPDGFWATGYGEMHLSDTGSALNLFAVLYKYVDPTRQKKYLVATKRYMDAIEANDMILPNGSFASGWNKIENGKLVDRTTYLSTLSSVLTGVVIYTWMYHVTNQDRYRQIAHRALQWAFSTMHSNGEILNTYLQGGEPPAKTIYGTAAYVSEGVIAFDLYCGNPAWKTWIEKTVRPNIEFLLRNQHPNGIWGKGGGLKDWDRTRSGGIVNYLIWYYDHVDPDPRIQKAVQRFDAYITNPENGKAFGLLIDGAPNPGTGKELNPLNAATALTGRAIADILKPGVDATW